MTIICKCIFVSIKKIVLLCQKKYFLNIFLYDITAAIPTHFIPNFLKKQYIII